jgi:hypothetical protein
MSGLSNPKKGAPSMNGKNEVIHLLEKFPHLFKKKADQPGLRFSYLEDGIPRGAITEVSGRSGGGKTELVLRFLAENPEARVAWVEEELTIYPCAFPQNRVELERVLFVDAPFGKKLWTAHQILRSGACPIVVIDAQGLSEADLRRLQLAAERADAAVILLTQEPSARGAWPIAAQLAVQRPGRESFLKVDVMKYRGQAQWQLQIG